jgi:hypothetical protein
MAVNDIGITSSSYEWQHTTDRKKKDRWRGGVLYFGRVQSAHLFEAAMRSLSSLTSLTMLSVSKQLFASY